MIAEPDGAELARGIFARLTVAQTLAAGVGALVVAGFLIAFRAGYGDDRALIGQNVAATVGYLALTLWAGRAVGRRSFAPVAAWLASGRPATEEERTLVLRSAVSGTQIAAAGWVGAAVLFTLINVQASVATGLGVGAAILLGGATTCALAYLSFERILRPVVARALASGPPPQPVGPGVGARVAMAWLLGTGVPALSILGVAGAHILGAGINHDQVIFSAVFLAIVMLVAGSRALLAAARTVAEPVAAMRAALGSIEAGEFARRVPVEDGSEIGLLQDGFNRMAAGLAERDRIRETFGTYVDRDVAEHILREGTALSGEEVEVTAMFVDVRDFTGFADGATAPEVVAALNRLFERIVPVVHAHGGHVDKFAGDGLLAVFGAPRRDPDHARHALAAALEIERAVSEEELRIGIGLNSGSVVAGNVGGGGRLEFSVIGDVVNVAARVEAATRQTGDIVLVTARTAELAGGDFTPRAGVTLKGKREPVSLYAPAG